MSTSLSPHIVSINHSGDVLTLLELILTDEGYRVTSALHCDTTHRTLRAAKPDLLLIDYLWPSDDDSWALLRQVRRDRTLRSVPIVLCTGAIDETLPLLTHLATMGVRVIWQPFDLDQLLTAVTRGLHHDSPEAFDPQTIRGTDPAAPEETLRVLHRLSPEGSSPNA